MGEESAASVTAVCNERTSIGEGPIWVEAEQAVYWVDVDHARVLQRAWPDGETAVWTPSPRISSLYPRREGGFVGSTDDGFAFIDFTQRTIEPIADPEAALPNRRFNDGKPDRAGRFWSGTMSNSFDSPVGALYRLDGDRRWSRQDSGYFVTNGPAFSLDGRTMYHTDTIRREIYAFDIDASGAASGKEVFVRFGEGEGVPDGMTVDADGILWVAMWGGSCLRRFSPGGDDLGALPLPVSQPTSCIFGGPEYRHLFVTSARFGLSDEQLRGEPLAGALLVAQPGVQGLAESHFPG